MLNPLSSALPKTISQTNPIGSNNTAKDRVNAFYTLLNSADTARFRTITPYQKKWIAQAILSEKNNTTSSFQALAQIHKNDGNKYAFTFEVEENGIEMQVYEQPNRHIQTGSGDEKIFLGAIPNLTFNDFELAFPPV